MRDAILRHHPASQQVGDAEFGQRFFKVRLLEAVCKLLDHHRGVRGGDEDAGRMSAPGVPSSKNGAIP